MSIIIRGTGNWIDSIVAEGGVPQSYELIAGFLGAEKRLAKRVAVSMEHQMANIIRREFYDEFMEFVEAEKIANSLDTISDVSNSPDQSGSADISD